MSSMLLVAILLLALTLIVGGAVVLVGFALVIAVLVLRRRASTCEQPAEPLVARSDPQASPAPLTRLEADTAGLRAVPAQPSPQPAPPRSPPAPTLTPEDLDEGTEAFGNLAAFFDKLDSASEEDRTELLSKAERERLYGFDIGKEERERTDYDIVKD